VKSLIVLPEIAVEKVDVRAIFMESTTGWFGGEKWKVVFELRDGTRYETSLLLLWEATGQLHHAVNQWQQDTRPDSFREYLQSEDAQQLIFDAMKRRREALETEGIPL